MRAAIWTGGDPPHKASVTLYHQLVDFAIAADGGSEVAAAYGFPVDYWVGDGDSGQPASFLKKKNIQRLDREKDQTDTEAAVTLAEELGADDLILLGGGGRRVDHWLSNWSLVRKTVSIRKWITAFETCDLLKGPARLDLSPGLVSVFALDDGKGHVRSAGLRWSLDRVDFSKWHSLSNIVEKTEGTIWIETGRFMIARPVEEKV